MDIASIVGLVVCLTLTLMAIIVGNGVAAIYRDFMDFQSALITFGGAFCAILAGNTIESFVGGLKSFALVLKRPNFNIPEMIQKVIDLSNVARKEGLLSLEEAAGDIDDAVWRYQVDFLAVEEALVSNRLVTRAREVDLPGYVWSVYDQEKMLQYLEMGLGGIITGYPQLLEEVLGSYESRHAGMEYAHLRGVLRRR